MKARPLNKPYVNVVTLGEKNLCRSKGCKVAVCQTLRMIQSSRTQTQAACLWFVGGRIFFHNSSYQVITASGLFSLFQTDSSHVKIHYHR